MNIVYSPDLHQVHENAAHVITVGFLPTEEEPDVEAKVVKRGRPRKVNTTEGVETK